MMQLKCLSIVSFMCQHSAAPAACIVSIVSYTMSVNYLTDSEQLKIALAVVKLVMLDDHYSFS